MINLELFRVFYTVCKCGSITKASDKLCVSQSAVSQQVKQLENNLGGKLFNRSARGIELTENGKQIFEYVEKAIILLDKAENKFLQMQNEAQGSLRIGASDSVTSHILMDYIKKFNAKYPSVTVSFLNNTSHDTIDAVKNNKADIGFVNLPITDDNVIVLFELCKLNDIFVANSKYKNLLNKKVTINTLKDYPLLMLEQNTITRKEFNNFTTSMNVELHPNFEFASLELCTQMAKNGLGVACVAREFVKEELISGELFEIDVFPSIPTRAIGVIVKKDSEYSFVLKEFINLISKNN